MDPKNIVRDALAQGRRTLTEAESKRFLGAYGVPVVPETTAVGPREALAAARAIGFPVVLKGLGVKLTHKTERGLVKLNLTGPEEFNEAARGIAAAAGQDLEGFLVQPMLEGRREFLAGLFRDNQFGPVVMFGLGGVFTEALDDVVFRLSPLTRVRAEFMLGEIKAAGLLGPFRGEKPADRQALIQTLTALSRVGQECPEVMEVDINPLLIGPDGRVLAVDALVVVDRLAAKREVRPAVDPGEAGKMFYPRSVAFVGASSVFRKWGHLLFTNVVAGGYGGQIYLVNAKGGIIAGREAYKSVTDIPEPVDLAVITVPAASVPALLPSLEEKGIKYVVLITSGFAETGPEGRRLEEELVVQARARGILILGPNTMGICNPHHRFHCLGSHARPQPGATAFVSQSGNMGVQLLSFAEQQGIGIRAFAGSGNEAMFTIEDVLDAFAVDNLTNTVLLYIESVKNGRRFFESARKVSRRKPVVVLKGGRTEAGGKAAASHTGALAGSQRVFDAACRQAGLVLADRSMDLLDLSAAFSSLPLPKGQRVAIMTLGGGWGVVTADLCAEYGLELPELSPEIIASLDRILPPYWSRSNPVDLVGETDPNIPLQTMRELMAWDGCDAVLNLGIMNRKIGLKKMIASTMVADPDIDPIQMDQILNFMIQYEKDYVALLVRLMEEHAKPVLGVSLSSDSDDRTVYDVPGARYKGIFFPSPERAVKALAEMCEYERWLRREEEEEASGRD
ncbi:MAG: acetate--CoA ligase family protein [Thermodesulfobacteriota bacterium]